MNIINIILITLNMKKKKRKRKIYKNLFNKGNNK